LHRAIERFLRAVEEPASLWRSIDLRVLAIRIDDQWHNLATTCSLDTRAPEDVPLYAHWPRSDHVAAGQDVLGIEALSAILSNVAKGQLKLNSEVIHYSTGLSRDERTPYRSWDYSFSSLSERRVGERPAWAYHQLLGTGDSGDAVIQNLPYRLSELDDTMRALQHPFDGIDGVARILLGETGATRSGRLTIFKALAPIPVRLRPGECRLEGRKLHFAVVSASEPAIDHCSLGFIAMGQDEMPISDSIGLPREGWTSDTEELLFVGKRELPGIQAVSLFLRVGSRVVERMLLVDPAATSWNHRVIAYRVFDPDLDLLRSYLKQAGPADSAVFERGVARLLTLLGFQVDQLSGDRRLGDAVDLIGYADPTPLVFAVECTTGSIDAGGKLGKLVARSKQLEAALPNHEILPVLVTALAGEAISEAELKSAAEDNVAVLAQEDLDELFVMLAEASSLSQVIGYIRRRGMSGGFFSFRGRRS